MFIVDKRWMDQDATWWEVDLGPGDIALDGDRDPPHQRGIAPNFQPMSVVAKRLDGSICHLVRRKPRPRDIALDGDPAPPEGGTAAPPIFWPVSVVAIGRPSQLLLSTCSISKVGSEV